MGDALAFIRLQKEVSLSKCVVGQTCEIFGRTWEIRAEAEKSLFIFCKTPHEEIFDDKDFVKIG